MRVAMGPLTLLSSLLLYAYPAVAQQTTTYDPLTQFLIAKGFSNIPYIKQNQARIGAVVAVPNVGGIPVFEVPDGNTPKANPAAVIKMPGETVALIQHAGLGIKVFGFDSGVDFDKPDTLSYGTIELTGPQLDIDQVRSLLAMKHNQDNLNRYKGGLTSVKKRQMFTAQLYLVAGVFYAKGMDITSSTGKEVALKTNATVPACPNAPATPPVGGQPAATGTSTDSSTSQAEPPKGQGAAANGDAQAGSSVKGKKDAKNGSENEAPKEGNSLTALADKVTSDGTPGGYGHYCRKSNGAVHFTSNDPIPLAMEVYSAYWDQDKNQYVVQSPNSVPVMPNN